MPANPNWNAMSGPSPVWIALAAQVKSAQFWTVCRVSPKYTARMAERLTLSVDPARTPDDRIEATVRNLGYGVAPKGTAPEKRGFVIPDDATPALGHHHDRTKSRSRLRCWQVPIQAMTRTGAYIP